MLGIFKTVTSGLLCARWSAQEARCSARCCALQRTGFAKENPSVVLRRLQRQTARCSASMRCSVCYRMLQRAAAIDHFHLFFPDVF